MTTQNSAATQAYTNRRNEIARLIDLLEQELDVLDARRTKQCPDGWMYVSDLGHIREELVNLLAFVSGVEPAAVRAMLGIEDA